MMERQSATQIDQNQGMDGDSNNFKDNQQVELNSILPVFIYIKKILINFLEKYKITMRQFFIGQLLGSIKINAT